MFFIFRIRYDINLDKTEKAKIKRRNERMESNVFFTGHNSLLSSNDKYNFIFFCCCECECDSERYTVITGYGCVT